MKAACLLFLLIVGLTLPVAAANSAPEAPLHMNQICLKQSLEIHCAKCSFDQYETRDKFNRTITFYISQTQTSGKQPLAVLIQGSGGGSVFVKDGDKTVGTTRYQGYLDQMQGLSRLLIVEKPGVKLFEEPKHWGSAEGCSEEFLREYTLERWTEAINAAIRAAQSLPEIDTSKLLVAGNSDGGQVATHVAYSNPKVTHVASIAGGGPTQLFDMVHFTWLNSNKSEKSKQKVGSAGKAVEEVYEKWAEIQADPDSISKFWSGHPYRRWSTFCSSSSLEDLLHCNAKAYIVQGTEDVSVPVASFDVLRSELAVHRHEVIAERIEGANHGMKIKAKSGERDEMTNVVGRIVQWYLGSN